jgi:hypothetical protein
MTACDRIRADAPGLMSLPADDPDRVAAVSHASGCAACARALREAERLQSLLSAVEPGPLPAGAFERASAEIRAQLRREARRSLVGAIAGVCAAAAVFVGFARARSPAPVDWALAAVLAALAVVLAAAAGRRPPVALALSAVAALVAVAISGAGGPLAPSVGAECLGTELASAGIVVGAVWVALRSRAAARLALAGTAAAGALAGDAALQLTCPAHTALPHLLAFHVGGVVLAAAIASLLWRAPRPVAARPLAP